jgi:SSS family solute:Na+ symporter
MAANLARDLGLAVLPLYLSVTLLIGWIARRKSSTSNEFLNASRSMPLWVVAASFFSVNCGALEIVGLSAAAAQYGVQAFHFYWIGAIPGMVFMGGVMIPLYMRSGVHSLPEYLERRFDARVRLINAWLLLIISTAISGIGLYAIAQVLNAVYHWSFFASAALAGGVVLVYALMGGLRATIFNEVFRVAIIVLGLLPLMRLSTTSFHPAAFPSGPHAHLWLGLPTFSPASELDQLGVVGGLGMVLSFSYWCTDFVLVQRALTARTVQSGQMVPLLAGFAKLGFSFLVICPALGAAAYLGGHMPASFDQTLPVLMLSTYSPLLVGLGFTVLLASLMSALGANVLAFSALWTEEIYRRSIRQRATERHYLRMGRASIAAAIALSFATSYITFRFRDLMEYNQLLFSLFSAPFFAVFLLGLFGKKATARGALTGIAFGVAAALVHLALAASGRIDYGSMMSANFYIAMVAFTVAIIAGLAFSSSTGRKSDAELDLLVYRRKGAGALAPPSLLWWTLAATLVCACALLNFWWR